MWGKDPKAPQLEPRARRPQPGVGLEEQRLVGLLRSGLRRPGRLGRDNCMDYRSQPREDPDEDLSGFQIPPVNWGINTAHKKAFFERVKEITGMRGGGGEAEPAVPARAAGPPRASGPLPVVGAARLGTQTRRPVPGPVPTGRPPVPSRPCRLPSW